MYYIIPFVERTKKDAICNVPLPPTQPLASPDAQVAQRLFIVLAAVRIYISCLHQNILINLTLFQNLPHSILKNIFSCWKGLIDVYLLPNKNCGYVKYAERESAQKAIGVLNGAEICGTKIKVLFNIKYNFNRNLIDFLALQVMEAEERSGSDGDDSGRKRLRRN